MQAGTEPPQLNLILFDRIIPGDDRAVIGLAGRPKDIFLSL